MLFRSVTRALGVEDTVLLEVNEHRVEPGDIYLMCSDGLSDMVSDASIAQLLLAPGMPENKAQSLIAAANEAGGRDNISVLIIQAQDGATKRGLMKRLLGK